MPTNSKVFYPELVDPGGTAGQTADEAQVSTDPVEV